MQLVVISGRSGSGKSTALNALADHGFNCIDNFPVRLLEALVDAAEGNARLAICVDARNTRADLERLPTVLLSLRRAHPALDCRIVYLDARSPTLVMRFSETRRRHPLTDAGRDLREAIDLERGLLADIAGLADLTIDTTTLSAAQLLDVVKDRVAGDNDEALSLLFRSFAYKSGVPVDADFVFDVRCLPNPYWRREFRDLSGLDEPVREYLDGEGDVTALCRDICGFLDAWIPRFEASNRRYLSVAAGCTGGRHRSVYVVERLATHFRRGSATVLVRHRELSPRVVAASLSGCAVAAQSS